MPSPKDVLERIDVQSLILLIKAKNYIKVDQYKKENNISNNHMGRIYAMAGDDEKANEYRVKHPETLHQITRGYVDAGNFKKVEEYRINYNASVIEIYQGCIELGNREKINEYQIKGYGLEHIPPHSTKYNFKAKYKLQIVKVDVLTRHIENGNDEEVEKCRIQDHLPADIIAKLYAQFGRHSKVEEYLTQYKASMVWILDGYKNANNQIKIDEYQQLIDNFSSDEETASQSQDGQLSVQTPILNFSYPALLPGSRLKSIEDIKGGIHTKYLTGTAKPRLPESQQPFNAQVTLQQQLLLVPVHQTRKNTSTPYITPISTDAFQATLFTYNKDVDLTSCTTFVCAGRVVNAHIPQSQCTLICTEDEIMELLPYLSPELSLLLVTQIKSEYNGEYTQLSGITARRLAAFLFAHYAKCSHFVLLDDNIRSISSLSELVPSNSWNDLVDLLKSQMGRQASLSVGTTDGRKKKAGALGSKFFMINMEIIRQRLKEEDLFCLFPEAVQANKWGEDYYFQIALHYLFIEQNIAGYGIIPLDIIGLTRSKLHQNKFAASGQKAELFALPYRLENDSAPFVLIIKSTIEKLNQIIKENYKRDEQQRKFLSQVDLLSVHAKANHQSIQDAAPLAFMELDPIEFNRRFAQYIDQYDFTSTMLRDYQVEAIQAAANYSEPARIVMATGSGKSLIQSTLALMAYHASTSAQPVFIVTPQIDLVLQFYLDLIHYNNLLHEQGNPLAISAQDIITLCSHQQSIHLDLLLQDEPIHRQRAIIICCTNSFNKLLEEDKTLIQKASLILLDEYHEYSAAVKQLIEQLSSPSPMIIASSATPPSQDFIKSTLYSLTMQQALNGHFHAPVVADYMNFDYSLEHVQIIINNLPKILRNHYHPGFGEGATLAETKGIIYLASTALCQQAQQILRAAGLNAYCINSKNPKATAEAKQFVRSTEPGVLLAVRMLRYGFDCPDLAWEFILRPPNGETPKQDIEQMLGRVIRLYGDKIGYVVTFADIFNNYISSIIECQTKLFPLSQDYLADAKVYRIPGSNERMMIVQPIIESPHYSVKFFPAQPNKREREPEQKEAARKKASLV